MKLNQNLICFILLKLLFNLNSIQSSITVFDQNNVTVTQFDSLSAAFGPRIDDDGLQGYIAVANPLGGCSKMDSPPANVSYVDPKKWIALIVRTPTVIGNCSFDIKVLNAQRAGFSAVIIYNSESDNLIKMSSNGFYSIKIPSVFIGHSNGLELKNFYTYTNKTYVVISNDDGDLNYLLIPFISVVSICFLVAVCIFLIKLALHCRKIRKNRVPKSALRKIPTKKYQKTDKYDTCPICLNEYEEGVKIRLLPCEHVYHIDCIDKWLLRNNRFCPVCKRRVLPGGESDSEDNDNTTTTTQTNDQLNRVQTVDESQPNDDEDTNENSRLLIRSQDNQLDSASVQTTSTTFNNPNLTSNSTLLMNNDLTSLNNHMTTSMTSSNQLASKSGDNLAATSSKYGSISSINLLKNENEKFDSDQSDSESNTKGSSNLPKSSTRSKMINNQKATSSTIVHIDSKHTPEFFTPRSPSTTENMFTESLETGSKITDASPVETDSKSDKKDIKLKALNKNKKSNKANKNKVKPEQLQSAISNSKPINNENLSKITAKLVKDTKSKENSLINPVYDEQDDSELESTTTKKNKANENASSSVYSESVVNIVDDYLVNEKKDAEHNKSENNRNDE